MTQYYIADSEGKIKFVDDDIERLKNTLLFLPEYTENDIKKCKKNYIIDNFEMMTVDEQKEKQNKAERERLDSLTLTPADVERALYKAKAMDFDDLKVLITEKLPDIDTKALAIEFRAKDFYRGATIADGTRLFDVVGALLGYTSDNMDYLFENKELPKNDNSTDTTQPDTVSDEVETENTDTETQSDNTDTDTTSEQEETADTAGSDS